MGDFPLSVAARVRSKEFLITTIALDLSSCAFAFVARLMASVKE
jgi:hypothetical protein